MQQSSIRRSPWHGLRLAVVAAAAFGPAGGRLSAAEVEPLALIWNAPAGCPTVEVVRNQVQRSLGGSPEELGSVAAVVNVVQGADGLWRASLVVHSHGKGAERQFHAESCPALASAAALIIALAAEGTDDSALARPAAHGEAPERRDHPAIASAARLVPAAPEPGWNRAGSFLTVGVLVDGGTMPSSPATGIEVAAGESWNSSLWRLRLVGGASYFLPESLSQSPLNFGFPAGHYWLLSFMGRGCFSAVVSRFEIGPCLGGELVVMRGTGIGQTTAHSTQYWASPLIAAAVAVTVAPEVVVFARFDVAIPSTRRSFLDDTNTEIYKVPAVAARGAVGVEVRFF